MLFDKLTRGAISDIIIERITDALVSGELKPGDKIPTEMEFCEFLGVSRNSVREALKVLVAFGVLEIRRGEGTFIAQEFTQQLLNPMIYGMLLAEKSAEDMVEFKNSNLLSIIVLAVKKGNEEDAAHLHTLVELLAHEFYNKPFDIDELYACSQRFYSFLGRITRNPIMIQLNEMVIKLSKYSRIKALVAAVETGQEDLLLSTYREIATIIKEKNRDGVYDVIDHVLRVWDKLLSIPAPAEVD
ncbi:MAG: GntR family transcriptional regulator [Clostridiales Family XIII bacterium]|jgi:GntR family transcriptional repressor for pyruvate dehydrogenase complex|nr:GntR family transcriptional regulator [Clostridiales Family XIII bacterium]